MKDKYIQITQVTLSSRWQINVKMKKRGNVCDQAIGDFLMGNIYKQYANKQVQLCFKKINVLIGHPEWSIA